MFEFPKKMRNTSNGQKVKTRLPVSSKPERLKLCKSLFLEKDQRITASNQLETAL